MLRITSITGTEPIDLATAKLHLRVDDSYEDALITEYISAARSHCERFTGLSLIAQTISYHMELQDASENRVTLPIGPAVSVESVTDDTGEAITPTWVTTACPTVLTITGASDGVTVAYTTDASMITSDVKTAMLMLIHQMYQSRGSVDGEAVMRVEEAYLRNHRVLFGCS
jgi:hypothetical protein